MGSKLSITEEEARQYYLAHKDEFVEPATVTLREIFIEMPTTTQGGEEGVTRRRRRRGEERSGGRTRANHRRRGLRQGCGRSLRLGVEGERRPDRPVPPERRLGGAAQDARDDEAGRGHPADARRQGIPDPEARSDEDRPPRSRSKRSATWSPTRSTAPPAVRDAEVPRPRIRSQAMIEWKNQDLKKLYEQRIAAAATAPSN